MAVSKEVWFRSKDDSSLVKPTKTGTVPKGLMIENKEAKANKNNSMFFLQIKPDLVFLRLRNCYLMVFK
jgi:hypothetical protein